MKTIIYKTFAAVLLILIIAAFKKTEKDILVWKEGRPLTWDDFNGKPEKRFAAASTHYDIIKSILKAEAKPMAVTIEAVFFRNSSWKKKSWINDQVLAHEQKHFDIVELFARKLRKSISETRFKSYTDLVEKVNALYDKNDKEMDIYQDQYDDETDGSMNGEKQRTWEKKIMQEINDLKKFEKTAVEVSLN
jgi:hypothetical protein